MSSDVTIEWFSAADLAALGAAGVFLMPRSERRAGESARKFGWEERQVPGKGGKGGMRTEYRPSENILAIIQSFLQNNPTFFGNRKFARENNDKMVEALFSAAYKTEPIRPLVSGNGVHSGATVDDHSYKLAKNQDAIYIESYPEVRGAAGTGQVTPTDQVIIKLAVNAADWRNYVGLDHRHIKVVAVHGDSMKPALSHGDQVLVDTACNRFIDNDIYAIQQGDLTRFKRIKLRLDGSIEVKSDNEKEGFKLETYTAEEAAEFKLIGRVIPFKFGRFDS